MISEPVISSVGCSEALCRVGDYSVCCVWASDSCLWWHEVLLPPGAGFTRAELCCGQCCYNGCWISPRIKPVLCQCLYSEILPHTSFWLFKHAAKIMHTYLKIYVLTWALSLGRTPWVSHSGLKPNVSVFHVYSFHKHSTYAVCSCYPKRLFSPWCLGDLCFKNILCWWCCRGKKWCRPTSQIVCQTGKISRKVRWQWSRS